MLDDMDFTLCDVQGRLFELAAREGYDSEAFVKFFMNSEAARHLDSSYSFLQWAGEEYLLEEVIDESAGRIGKSSKEESEDAMFWIGFIYRYWHYFKNETSRRIYRQADYRTMNRNYFMFHTMDPEMAIEDLIEIHKKKRA